MSVKRAHSVTQFHPQTERPRPGGAPPPPPAPQDKQRYESGFEPSKGRPPTYRLSAQEKAIIEANVRVRIKQMVKDGYPQPTEAQINAIITQGELAVAKAGGFAVRDETGYRVENFNITIDSLVASVTHNGLGGGGGIGSIGGGLPRG